MVEAPSERNETLRAGVSAGGDEGVLLSAPSALPALPPLGGNPLRFASGEAAVPYVVPAKNPRKRARRPTCSDLFDLAVIALIIVCAAVCVYRLFWAIQP